MPTTDVYLNCEIVGWDICKSLNCHDFLDVYMKNFLFNKKKTGVRQDNANKVRFKEGQIICYVSWELTDFFLGEAGFVVAF